MGKARRTASPRHLRHPLASRPRWSEDVSKDLSAAFPAVQVVALIRRCAIFNGSNDLGISRPPTLLAAGRLDPVLDRMPTSATRLAERSAPDESAADPEGLPTVRSYCGCPWKIGNYREFQAVWVHESLCLASLGRAIHVNANGVNERPMESSVPGEHVLQA
jgi:hypothetical protein